MCICHDLLNKPLGDILSGYYYISLNLDVSLQCLNTASSSLSSEVTLLTLTASFHLPLGVPSATVSPWLEC